MHNVAMRCPQRAKAALVQRLIFGDDFALHATGRGLQQQQLPQDVLNELAKMGLTQDDVEVVEYPPGTDRDEALNDFYARQVRY